MLINCTGFETGTGTPPHDPHQLHIHNTSQYPDTEIRALITAAVLGLQMDDVQINVKNTKHAYAGRAYAGVPAISPARRIPGIRYLIVLRIGPATKYPCDNLYPTWSKWEKLDQSIPVLTLNEVWPVMQSRSGIIYGRRRIEHPYGGKSSPLIHYIDWREGLVGLAAHEARHIYQFRHKKPTSEVDCEQYSFSAIAAYRDLRDAAALRQP